MNAAPAFQVRDARNDERSAIAELTLRAYGEYAQTMTPTAWDGLNQAVRRTLAANDVADRIVAADEQTLIGSVMLYPAGSDAYRGATPVLSSPEVRLLVVAPEARGRGVAAALMDECIRRAKAAGAASIGLHTSHSMHAAKRLYDRLGFVRAPELDFRPPGAELVEGYRLPLG